ncbi:hypothetical protein VTI74DRAFT_8264 [Chaetomium olivicolor]
MAETTTRGTVEARLPRVTIEFCTQCKWMLRAAYYAQELLQTFSTSLGEVALQPSTGGVFVVTIHTTTTTTTGASAAATDQPAIATPTVGEAVARVLWDRKTDGGFPETKELKRRVRDVIEPGRDLGHVDREYPRGGNNEAVREKGGVGAAGAGAGAEAEGKKEEEERVEGEKGAKGCGLRERGVKCEDCE